MYLYNEDVQQTLYDSIRHRSQGAAHTKTNAADAQVTHREGNTTLAEGEALIFHNREGNSRVSNPFLLLQCFAA